MKDLHFDSERVMSLIKSFSKDIGPRFTGSEKCRKAADLIHSYFADLGLDVKEQDFEVDSGSVMDYSIEVQDPYLKKIPCRPMYFAEDTPIDGLVGEIVYVEGLEEPQIGNHLKGKIVLWSRSGLTSATYKPENLFRYEPLAIIMISMTPGFTPRHDIIKDFYYKPFNPVPMFQIAWDDGYELVQKGAKKVKLVLRSKYFKGVGHNVIGELKGSERPDEIIVISGHYDSPPDTPSATDNASGTAMMMELARLYSQRGSKRTLRFAAWDAEEGGMMGSGCYVKMLQKQAIAERKAEGFEPKRNQTLLDRHLLCINMDVLGMAVGHNSCYVLGPKELFLTMGVITKELGIPHQVIEDDLYGSDHEPFAWAGIPAIDFSRVGPSMQYIHTSEDTLDLILAERLQDIGKVIDTFVSRNVALAETWPFERAIPEKLAAMVKAKFEKVGWKEEH